MLPELESLVADLEKFDAEHGLVSGSRAFVRSQLPRFTSYVRELEAATKGLILMARTTGGVAGRDAGLCAALDRAEAALITPPRNEDKR